MFPRETVEHCATCGVLTPHSRQRFSFPALVSLAAFVGAAACAWLGEAWWIVAGVLGASGLFVLLSSRERFGHVPCERCRVRKMAELRRTKPTLRGNTEINIS